MRFSPVEDQFHTLKLRLGQARRAMLWAIADKNPAKAYRHAKNAARLVRLLQQRCAKFGYSVEAVLHSRAS